MQKYQQVWKKVKTEVWNRGVKCFLSFGFISKSISASFDLFSLSTSQTLS